jgi:hypothetical protein
MQRSLESPIPNGDCKSQILTHGGRIGELCQGGGPPRPQLVDADAARGRARR